MPTFSFSNRGSSRAPLNEEVEVKCNNCSHPFLIHEEYFNFDSIGENKIAGDLDSLCPNCNETLQIRFHRISKPKEQQKYTSVGINGALLIRGFGKEAEVSELKNISLIRKIFSESLIKLIASNPKHLQDVEWRELEYLLAVAFEKIGFGVELTPSSKDGGKDLVLTCRISGNDRTYYVEVKHWRSLQKVGKQNTNEFLKVIVNEKVDGGLFLSTYGQSTNAIESLTSIERKMLKFGDERKIETLCKTYGGVKGKRGLKVK